MRLWEGQLLFPGIECPYRIREVLIDEEGQWETSPPPLCTPSSFNREGFTSECRNWQTILSNLLLKCKFDELLLLPKYYNKQKLHYKWHEWFNKVTESYCLQKILCTTLPRQLKVLGRCIVGIVFSILIIIVIVILASHLLLLMNSWLGRRTHCCCIASVDWKLVPCEQHHQHLCNNKHNSDKTPSTGY